MLEWVLMAVVAKASGYTTNALRMKCRRGHLVEGVHWKYSPDGKILIHVANFNQWMKQ